MLHVPMKRDILYFLILLSALIFLTEFLRRDTLYRSTPAEPYPIRREIRYSFTLQNQTDRLLEKAEFWAYAPVKRTAFQRCDRLEVSHPHELILDEFGNQILFFRVRDLPPFGSLIITVTAHLSFSPAPKAIPLLDPQRFLRPEPFYEVDAPEVARLARTLRSQGSRETGERVFQWITSNVKYSGYTRNDRGALYALRKKEGDCTEFMYLFTALCRANGIPARGIGGYVCGENAVLRSSEYHNWAEFYEGKAWRIADPQRKMFMKEESHYVAMRVVGESEKNPMPGFHRFRFVGDGLKVRMNG